MFEQQQYMKEVSKNINSRVSAIKQDLSKTYFNLVLNKLASALPVNFLLNIYKIKKTLSVDSSQQFLYDLQNELKVLLISLPKIDSDSNIRVSDGYKMLVDKYINKVVGRFKLLSYPADPEIIREGYQQILGANDNS